MTYALQLSHALVTRGRWRFGFAGSIGGPPVGSPLLSTTPVMIEVSMVFRSRGVD
jgi:hypothetical protein